MGTPSPTQENCFVSLPRKDKVTTIVAIHGTLGSHRDFRYLAGALSNFGEKLPVELIRMDLPGYGSSKNSWLCSSP